VKNNKLLIPLAIAAFTSGAFAADDEINYSFSLKDWNHKFKQSSSTEAVNSPILSGTARKGDYFITGSSLLPTTYSFADGSQLIRRDNDIALGYSINSNFSLLGGKKNILVRTFSTSNALSQYNINLNYLGANGFTAIGEKSFLYGTYTSSVSGKRTDTNVSVKFSNYEAGLGYVLSKDTQLTLGYRNQKFSFASGSAYNTTLSGLIFGVNITP
jgi:hypothetical protein